MIKLLFKDSVIYGLGTVLSKSITLLALPIITAFFTPSEFGELELLLTIAALLNIFFGLGMDSSFTFYFYKEDISNSDLYKTIFLTRIYSSIAISTIVFFSTIFYKYITGYEVSLNSIVLILLISFLQQMLLHLSEYYRLIFKPIKYVVATNMQSILGILPALYLSVYLEYGIEGYLFGLFIGLLNVLIIILIEQRSFFLSGVFNKKIFLKCIKFGLPLLPASLSMYIIMVSDRWMVALLTDNESLGFFALGAKLSLLFKLSIDVLRKAWWPHALKALHLNNSQIIFKVMANAYALITIPAALIFVLISPYLIDFFANENYKDSIMIANILVFESVIYGFFMVGSMGIWRAEKTIYNTYIMFLSATANIIFNFYLINLYGFIGAAFGTLFASIVWVVISCYVSYRLWNVAYDFLLLILFFITSFLISLEHANFINIDSLVNIFIYVIFITSATILIKELVLNIKKLKDETI